MQCDVFGFNIKNTQRFLFLLFLLENYFLEVVASTR